MSGSFQSSNHQLSTSWRPYLRDEVLRHLVAELFPLPVVLRRVRPSGVDVVVRIARLPEMAVRHARRRRRQRLRHEAELHERLHLARHVGVDDLVEDRPVVDRPAVGILGVDVRRTPLEGVLAVARREQVVHAHEHRDGARDPGAPTTASCRSRCRCSSARRGRTTPRTDTSRPFRAAVSTRMVTGSCCCGPPATAAMPARPRTTIANLLLMTQCYGEGLWRTIRTR